MCGVEGNVGARAKGAPALVVAPSHPRSIARAAEETVRSWTKRDRDASRGAKAPASGRAMATWTSGKKGGLANSHPDPRMTRLFRVVRGDGGAAVAPPSRDGTRARSRSCADGRRSGRVARASFARGAMRDGESGGGSARSRRGVKNKTRRRAGRKPGFETRAAGSARSAFRFDPEDRSKGIGRTIPVDREPPFERFSSGTDGISQSWTGVWAPKFSRMEG